MSAADHPIRGALSLAAGLVLMSAGVVAVPLVIAGGPVTFFGGLALSWRVVRHLSRDQQRRWQP